MSSDDRPEDQFDKGYTTEFLAYKHGLTIEQAAALIQEVGPGRRALDAAALLLKKKGSKEKRG